MNDIVKIAVGVLASLAAGAIGSLFTFKAIPTWYAGLKKPRGTPPNWAFGPVWTTLYLLMGISVFLVWRGGLSEPAALPAFILFWTQLAFNALWSIIFFGLKAKGGGLIVIGILWALILATIIVSFQVSAWAGALLVPYLIWVSVASYLNAGVWILNKPASLANSG